MNALRRVGGRPVLEIVAPHEADTYCAVYTVKFTDAIFPDIAFSGDTAVCPSGDQDQHPSNCGTCCRTAH